MAVPAFFLSRKALTAAYSRMEWLKRLRIYLSCEAGQHACLLGGLIVFALIIYSGSRNQGQQRSEALHAASWKLVEAEVLSSQITEVDASSDAGFSTRLRVKADFSYELNGQVTQASYAGIWHRNDYRDWSELLRPGSRIKIRISPHNPGKVSLVDYNGIQ
jgi:Protein of unknown function (DUF3592)